MAQNERRPHQFDWLAFLKPHIPALRAGRNGWASGHVPWRHDKRPSLGVSLKNGNWKDHGTGESGNASELCKKLGIETPTPQIYQHNPPAVRRPRQASADRPSASPRMIVATYIYTDEQGTVLFRKQRTDDKQFWLERPDETRGWIRNIEGVRIVPYRLQEIVQASTVAIVEGEKDADTLMRWNITTTTAPFGAARWPDDFADYLRGKELWILRDNDEAGRSYQLQAVLNCFAKSKSVKLIELPGLLAKQDLTDWYEGGHTREEFIEICANMKPLTEADLPALTRELEELKLKPRRKTKREKSGLDILSEGERAPKLHPAMNFAEDVLIYGFSYGDTQLWITSKRDILTEKELTSTYGEPAGKPQAEGPSREACERFVRGDHVDGPVLYSELCAVLTQHVAFPQPWQPRLLSLWILSTYVSQLFSTFPMVHVTSPDKRCGKTRLLETMGPLCYGAPQIQTNPSEAVLFREPQLTACPLFWDEAERLNKLKREEKDDRIAILNHAWRKGGVVKRIDKNTLQLQTFSVYRPMLLSGISRLPGTTSDRCLRIELQRKRAGESLKPLRSADYHQNCRTIRDSCYLFALEHAPEIRAAYNVPASLPLPEISDDRLRDNLEALFAVATAIDQADVSGPVTLALQEATRQIARGRDQQEEDNSLQVQTLRALWENFPATEERWILKGDQLSNNFHKWGLMNVENDQHAKRILNRLGFHSQNNKIDAKQTRGYRIEKTTLRDLIERYAPSILNPTAEQA